MLAAPGTRTQAGVENLQIGAKYEVYRDPTHEFIASLGVLRDFGRTGTARAGAGTENRWLGGLSIQYSRSYLDAKVRRLDAPSWILNATPVLEIAWSSPAKSPSNRPTQRFLRRAWSGRMSGINSAQSC